MDSMSEVDVEHVDDLLSSYGPACLVQQDEGLATALGAFQAYRSCQEGEYAG